jgi:hypothetical protein
MKLSEAILLGSTVLAPKAGQQHYSELNAGCALGMAAVAAGYTFRPVTAPVDARERRTLGAETVWGSWVLTTVSRPCDCWRIRVPREMRIKDIIAHLFDHHVVGRKNWTLEQLAAWVESVEPKDEVRQRMWYENPSNAISRGWRTSAPAQFEPSLEEIEEWETVRLAFGQKMGAERKRTRARL